MGQEKSQDSKEKHAEHQRLFNKPAAKERDVRLNCMTFSIKGVAWRELLHEWLVLAHHVVLCKHTPC